MEMSFKTLLTAKALVCLVFAPILLLAPGPLFELLGTSLGEGGAFPAREYAAAMLGTLMLTWFARNATDRLSRRAILLDLLVYDAVGAAITLIAILSGALNALAWGIFAIYLLFAVAPAYLLLKEPQSTAAGA
jgi:hypothetical protein